MTAMPHTFDPAEADPRSFRDALGRFATGVTVITCATPEGPLGITANSFSSVSLDPPLVLWSPAKRSTRHPFYVQAEFFAIHVLGAEQVDLCFDFARDGVAFGRYDWTYNQHGVPMLDGCLSRFECRQVAIHDAGDHSVVIGQVSRVTTRDGHPLVFSAGDYGRFQKA